MRNKHLKAGVILAVLAVAALVMAGAGAAGSTAFTPSENYYTTAGDLVNAMNASSTTGSVAALTTTFSQNDTVRLLRNVTVDTREIRVNGTNIVLDLNGNVLNTTSSCRVIRNDGSLTIVDSNPYNYHFFTMGSDGSWTWNNDAASTRYYVKGGVITGGNWESGGAIHTKGTLVLKSGIIVGNKSPNYGGGVYVADNATFTMNGGKITQCSGPYGGGVYVAANATFTMTGGTIEYCGAECGDTKFGGAVFIYDGSPAGHFTLDGGIISYCVANEGGAVFVGANSVFTMNSGEITDCHTSHYGGAVFVNGKGTFTMTGGTITYCYASYGGAVYVGSDAAFTMTGGTIIYCLSNYYGGAVYVDNNSTFTMTGGEISNCTPDCVYNSDGSSVSSNSAQSSAGVLTASAAENVFTEEITNPVGDEVSERSGGKVVINGGIIDGKVIDNGDLEIGGDAKITEIELPSGKQITILDTITDGAKIGIKLEDPEKAGKFLEANPKLVKKIIKNKIVECKNPGKHFDVDDEGNPVIKTDSAKSSSSVTSFFGKKDGSDFTFDRAVVITKATLPGATYATVTNTSGSGWYTCNLTTDGTSGTVYFQVPLDVIAIKGYTVSDVSLIGCKTTYLTSEGGYAKYSAVITNDGALTIDFEKDAADKAVEKVQEAVEQKQTATEQKQAAAEKVQETVEQKQTTQTAAKTPFPVLGILAGLGIAGLAALRRH